MTGPVTAVATMVALALWHLHNRRHPGWRVSPDGRFFVLSGYPALIIALYWLTTAPSNTAWEWALGNAWTVVSMGCFVYGFNALDAVPRSQQSVSAAIETLSPAADRTV
ncbi:hypothetical protein AU196_02145 [Mycobacterium sp. IS-1742]|uniref:hypothetical protein n=1 Tax=Mycobacterium sp. IS-1742 TaxID=1772285 RepID=UPI0007404BC5|nr:hypothetical protein [Mycobacterium sp. IS-1742]KUI23825.1 hypothetical protein AU196_02145 [Mycobacterium sp. IS-1742]